jgi:hypothetical protein
MATFVEKRTTRKELIVNVIVAVVSTVGGVWLGIVLLTLGGGLFYILGGLAAAFIGLFIAWSVVRSCFHTDLTLDDQRIATSGNPLESKKALKWTDITQANLFRGRNNRIIQLTSANDRIEFVVENFDKPDELYALVNTSLTNNGRTLHLPPGG